MSLLLPRVREDAAFSRIPDWAGVPCETGPLAREQSHAPVAELLQTQGPSALARLVARVAETARLLVAFVNPASVPDLRLHAGRLDDGVWACVDMARGVLVHWARLSGDRIEDYRIVAPTEWNFHPSGPCQTGLSGLVAAERAVLERRIAQHVTALDPCVRYTLEVRDA